MIKPFNIVRDLENKRYTEGSDSIVLTQFDKGIDIDFYILLSGKAVSWANGGYAVKVTFKNGNDVIIERENCDYHAGENKWTFEIDEKLTGKHGSVKGIIDVEHLDVRVASSQFELVVLEHLATK